MKPPPKTAVLGVGVILTILGLFLFGIAYSAYQGCLNVYGATCNDSRFPWAVPWGLPTEIVGGLITAIGAGLIVMPIVTAMGKKQPTSSS